MTAQELIKKLRAFPKGREVVIQFRSSGEWGSFDARSHIRSLVTRKVNGETATIVRCEDDWLESGGFG